MSSVAQPSSPRAVRIWLYLVWAMILAMVLVGGITRLTGSGLSMVEWHPLMGAVPPMNEAEWNEVFDQYKQSPQYLKVNHWMDLPAFKKIFFWEYIHRLIGRLIGLVVFVPCLYFWARKQMTRRLLRQTFIAIVLGGLQGLLGWFMVKSGLVDDPAVSHFRLAAHLLLAFFVGQWILWMLLDLRHADVPRAPISAALRRGIYAFLALLVVQIAYGAFVAGLRAGHMAMTFPHMNGFYAPSHFFTGDGLLDNFLHQPLAIHYVHRVLALIVLLAGIWLFRAIAKHAATIGDAPALASLLKSNRWMLVLLLLQVGLGIWTVLSFISIHVAVSHQGCAYILMGTVFAMLHRTKVGTATN